MRPLPLFEEDTPIVDWLFLDLNAYFASVEQQERPELRGRPIGIVPQICENTCCIAASYEAKAYGVKTGTGIAEAKIFCPHIELVEARPKLYVEYNQRIIEAVQSCVPISSVMSIDEMACRLIGRERFLSNANAIAYDIKGAIRRVGDTLRCSIGLAPNRYLAKIAADVCKPDGLFSIFRDELPQALYCLDLSDLVGVGNAMEQRLLQRGITTVAHLCSLSSKEMRDIWNSVLGERLWHWLRSRCLSRMTSNSASAALWMQLTAGLANRAYIWLRCMKCVMPRRRELPSAILGYRICQSFSEDGGEDGERVN